MSDSTDQVVVFVRVSAQEAIDGSRKATEAFARMEKAQDAANSTLSRMEASLGRVGGYLKAQIAVQVGELGARIVEMGRQAFEAAAGLDELAEQLGTNARALQGMQYEAAQYGVKSEQLETALSKFSQKMGEAANGSKDMVEALQALGVKNLDVQGKLRPTESLMQDVAKAIVSIDDPAKRSAAAVDFFGKSGTRMQPLLVEMAKGLDQMAASAERAGAMIGPQTIERLDKLSDRMEVNKLKWRAHTAEVLGSIAELGDGFNEWVYKIEASLNASFQSADEWARKFQESLATGAARGAAMFMEAFRALPDQLGKLFTDAFNKALEAVETGLNSIASGIANSWMGKTLGLDGTGVNLGRLNGGGASFGDYTGKIWSAGDAAARRMAEQFAQERATADAYAAADAASRLVGDLPRRSTYKPGAGTSGIKGAGAAEADAIEKARRDTQRDTDAQLEYAKASERGAKAVADLEIHFKALKAAQDAYGKTADQNKAGVEALTAELEKMMEAANRAKNLKDFNLGTADLEKANELLEAENRLLNESAEVRAREIAMIKLRQDVEAKGLDASNEKEREAIERRRAAIEDNERLKAQGEELKKANELWTAPLKSALESIQQTGADMWEKMLETGKFSAEEFAQTFAKMARRAAAQLLALATIRPVIQVAVQGLGSLGLVTPATAASLGYPTSGSATGAIGGSYGGGLGGGMFGGSSGLFSPGFMSQPIFGGIDSEIANWSTYGTAAQNSLAPTTWGQAFGVGGGLLSMGMGAMNLFNSRGNTGKTIGGIAGMLGGGLGIAGALMPAALGGMLGPIGMAVGLLGGLIPGLFGGEPERPPMPPLDYGAGGFNPNGAGYSYAGDSLNAGSSMQSQAQSIGESMLSMFSRAGLSAVPGRLIGGTIASGVNHVWQNGGWQGQPYTQIGLSGPDGLSRITYNDTSRNPEQAADMLFAEVFKANVLRGGVSGASDSLKTAVGTSNPTTAKAVQDLVDFVNIYDKIGKTSNATADALKAVDDKFVSITESATKYGLALEPVDKAKADEKLKIATDFATGIQRALDDMADPSKGLLDDLKKEYDALKETNDAIVKANVGGKDQILKIEELYAKKRTAIVEAEAKAQDQAKEQAQIGIWNITNPTLAAFAATGVRFRAAKDEAYAIGKTPTGGTPTAVTADLLSKATDTYNLERLTMVEDFIGGLRETITQLDNPMKATLDGLKKQRDANVKAAESIKDATGRTDALAVAMQAYEAQSGAVINNFVGGMKTELLQLTNPMKAQVDALQKQRDANVKASQAIEDTTQRTEALTTASELYTAQMDQLINNFLGGFEKRRMALVDPMRAQVDEWRAEYGNAIRDAMDLGVSTSGVTEYFRTLAKKTANDNNKEIERGLLAMSNPLAAQKMALDEAQDAALKAAEAINEFARSMGTTVVDTARIAEFYTKQKAEVERQYFEQTLGGLKDLVRRMTIGDLSGASSLTVLSGTQASYEAIRAQAFAGDVTARQNFSQSAGEYLTAGRDYYAYSPDYFAIRDQIKADIEALTVQIKGGTAGSGAPVSADVQALTQQLDRAMADNDNLKRTVEQLVASQAMTNDLLQRIVANQRP